MNKNVTFQSPEYYELLAMGWYVVAQVSASVVQMAHEGTQYTDRGGEPRTSDNPDLWLPQWGGKPGPAVTVVVPPMTHTWQQVSQQQGGFRTERVVLFRDTSSAGAFPGGYEFFKYDAYRFPYSVIHYSQTYQSNYAEVTKAYSLRSTTSVFDFWFLWTSKTIGSGALVKLQWFVPSVAGAVQYRVHYDLAGVITIHTHTTFAAAEAEYNSAV